MKFCTAVTCMDGRIQLPVIKYLTWRFSANYVDSITEVGPNLILSKKTNIQLVESIVSRLNTSINKHDSAGVAIVGHFDCAGNTASNSEQINQIELSVKFIQQQFKGLEVIGLWVDENWKVSEV